MSALLKFEFRKLKTKKSLYICASLMLLMLVLTAIVKFVAHDLVISLDGDPLYSLQKAAASSILDSSFTLFVGIFVVLFVCEDYSQKTVKNIYAKGYSRGQLFFAKLITSVLVITSLFIIVELLAFLLGYAFYGWEQEFNSKIFAILGVQYVSTIAELSLGFAIAVAIRKTGGAIAAYILAPTVIELVLLLINNLCRFKDFSLLNYWLTAFIDLYSLEVSVQRLWECLILALVYMLVFLFIGYLSHRKQDL